MQLDLLQEELFFKPTDSPLPLQQKLKSDSVLEDSTELDFFQNSPKEYQVKPLPLSVDTVVSTQAEIEIDGYEEIDPDSQLHGNDDDKLTKSPNAFKNISEAAKYLGVPQHVLRFWESRFAQIKPLKLAGGRRYYRPDDIEILSTIKHLLYKQGYTIKGAKKAFSSIRKSKGHQYMALDALDQPISAFPDVEPQVKPRVLSKKQIHQLSGIREELMVLRETLTPLLR